MTTSPEGRTASTPQNRQAARLMRDMRVASGLRQGPFTKAIADRLGITLQQSTVSSWESGARTVPAAAMLAAQAVSGSSLDYLIGAAQSAGADSRYHDVTRALVTAVEQLATLAAKPQSAGQPTAESILTRVKRARQMIEETDTPDD